MNQQREMELLKLKREILTAKQKPQVFKGKDGNIIVVTGGGYPDSAIFRELKPQPISIPKDTNVWDFLNNVVDKGTGMVKSVAPGFFIYKGAEAIAKNSGTRINATDSPIEYRENNGSVVDSTAGKDIVNADSEKSETTTTITNTETTTETTNQTVDGGGTADNSGI